MARLAGGPVLVALLSPLQHREQVRDYAARGVTAFAMELVPRISRAQGMDALSSQSNLAGYKAVLDAAAEFGKVIPMMMTAAGAIAPAKALVLGAGVAGLQAVATARRLGAVVSAFDVRPAVKEQVESLGAKFVEVVDEDADKAETSGGYAREMGEDYRRRQSALIHETLKSHDIAICTALIPGRPAPTLITAAMVEDMKPGSVIVDLATETGGNCELSRHGEVVRANGVTIVGHANVPSRVAVDASALYARKPFQFRLADDRRRGVENRLGGRSDRRRLRDSRRRRGAPHAHRRRGNMTDPLIQDFTVFVLAIFVGYYVVWSVTPALHTPLMSVTNAISGIIVVGALIAVGAEAGEAAEGGFGFSKVLGVVAVALASVNIFGGFIVTQRMLGMFRKRRPARTEEN